MKHGTEVLHAVVATLIATTGCYQGLSLDPNGAGQGSGSDGDAGDSNAPGADPEDPEGPADTGGEEACLGAGVGASGLTRLSRWQYDASIRDLLGLPPEARPSARLPPDGLAGPFSSNEGTSISAPGLEAFRIVAEELAEDATSRLDAFMPCQEDGDGCADTFIERFAERAFRRPLSDEERLGLRGLFDDGLSHADGVRRVIAAVLQSPSFLYRVEIGHVTDEPDVVRLTGNELAARLSLFLWGTSPDATLAAAADAGELDTDEGLEHWTRVLLEDPRSDVAIRAFTREWLGIEAVAGAERDPEIYGEFGPELRAELIEETERLAIDVLRNQDGSYDRLLTSEQTFATPQVAALYGIPTETDHAPGEFRSIDLSTSENGPVRAGILAHASVLASHAHYDKNSPTLRGLFVWERMLCLMMPPPPPGVSNDLPPRDRTKPLREQLSEHFSSPQCSSCHQLIDPIGFGFEHFDATGRYRDYEFEFPVDATGALVGVPGLDGPFDGLLSLRDRLLGSPIVSECISRQWLRFALQRLERDEDECSTERRIDAFEADARDIRTLIVETVLSDAFRMRRWTEESGD